MIDFTRAFDSAWERMHVILFRPFNFGKWCAIGFSAFLAGFLQGGNGLNTSPNTNSFNNQSLGKYGGSQAPKLDLHQLNTQIAHAFSAMPTGSVVGIVAATVILVFAFIFLIYWLGARGQFMFLDNVVRNRGAIAWPWQFYARQANSLFWFYVLYLLITLVLIVPIIVGAIMVCLPLIQHSRWPEGGEIVILVVLAVLYLVVGIVIGFILFIFREFGVPLMFRQGLLARPAFLQAMRLIGRFPGSITVFVLLRLAIFIGVAILSVIICCATCCIGALPYIGTVVLLPVLVYVKCFTLDCLAQFGPECDVWAVDVPPASPSSGMPTLSPPQPLG